MLPWSDKPHSEAKITWPLPDQSWAKSYPRTGQKSAILSALHTKTDSEKILDFENEIVKDILPRLANNSRKIASIRLMRSLTHLFLLLREYVDSGENKKVELCRRSIRELSQCFRTLNTKENLVPSDNEAEKISHVITIERWSEWIEKAFIQPPTVFLRLHDLLTEEVASNSEEERLELNAQITGLVNSCTQQVIETAAHRPQEYLRSSSQWSFDSGQNIGLNRRAAMLAGIWKMLLFYSMYRDPEEVAV
jgi:hypothetical protein